MHGVGFLLFGCQVFTDQDALDGVDKVTDEQKEAATIAMLDLSRKRLAAKILIITKGQVVALPNLEFDLLYHISVADIRGRVFLGRDNRTRG